MEQGLSTEKTFAQEFLSYFFFQLFFVGFLGLLASSENTYSKYSNPKKPAVSSDLLISSLESEKANNNHLYSSESTNNPIENGNYLNLYVSCFGKDGSFGKDGKNYQVCGQKARQATPETNLYTLPNAIAR